MSTAFSQLTLPWISHASRPRCPQRVQKTLHCSIQRVWGTLPVLVDAPMMEGNLGLSEGLEKEIVIGDALGPGSSVFTIDMAEGIMAFQASEVE